jgi:hypothetical protein
MLPQLFFSFCAEAHLLALGNFFDRLSGVPDNQIPDFWSFTVQSFKQHSSSKVKSISYIDGSSRDDCGFWCNRSTIDHIFCKSTVYSGSRCLRIKFCAALKLYW